MQRQQDARLPLALVAKLNAQALASQPHSVQYAIRVEDKELKAEVVRSVVTISSPFGLIQVTVDDDDPVIRSHPQGKVPGRRRYYRKLSLAAERVVVHPDGWYDYKHWHVDWRGLGNLSWRERRSHLVALFAIYRPVLAQIEEWSEPHQCWLQIDAADSPQDAVFLHTPKPNGTSFPQGFEYVRWEAEVPECLREFLRDPTWQFGRTEICDGSRRTCFLVRQRPTL